MVKNEGAMISGLVWIAALVAMAYVWHSIGAHQASINVVFDNLHSTSPALRSLIALAGGN